ncbi:jg22743, partial [Pararge aegeria aegeria]
TKPADNKAAGQSRRVGGFVSSVNDDVFIGDTARDVSVVTSGACRDLSPASVALFLMSGAPLPALRQERWRHTQ